MTERMTVTIASSSAFEVACLFLADLSGALFWQEQRLLVTPGLRSGKGVELRRRGVLLTL